MSRKTPRGDGCMSRKVDEVLLANGKHVRVLDLAGQEGQLKGCGRSGLSRAQRGPVVNGQSARAIRREVERKLRRDAKARGTR